MKVLVVGGGGREHALAWKIAQSRRVQEVIVAPGNAGTALEPKVRNVPVAADDVEGLFRLAKEAHVGLTVVGPEAPLAAGIVDRFVGAGLRCYGPRRAAAQLESSKKFAKEFMVRHRIPTARHESFTDLEAFRGYVEVHGAPIVVKADGLAAGKGVAVCASVAEAEVALEEMMGQRRFGAAGLRVVVEDVLVGEEASYYAISDGKQVATLAAAQDHKRALDGDRGENTGGMGAYAPAPLVTPPVEKRILEEIVHPTYAGLASEGMPYQGVLYVGLMIDPTGAPSVVEFNVRFGDPETQALVLATDGDLVPLLDGAARGTLEPGAAGVAGAAVCVVLASRGYPRAVETGKPITGLEAAEADPDVVVFHAGTKRAGGAFVSAGGRVLGVTARGADVGAARARAYAAADRIHFDGMQLRRDIAARALRA
jgi:phosphoribosylamine--glycine ligase